MSSESASPSLPLCLQEDGIVSSAASVTGLSKVEANHVTAMSVELTLQGKSELIEVALM